MIQAIPALAILAALAIAAVLLVMKLCWEVRKPAPVSEDPWVQPNDLKVPSVEEVPEVAHNEIGAAVAAQVTGTD